MKLLKYMSSSKNGKNEKDVEKSIFDIIVKNPLEMLKCFSYMSHNRVTMSKLLCKIIKQNSYRIKRVSIPFITQEMNKVLLGNNISNAFILMKEVGLLYYIWPELSKCSGVTQDKRHHKWDVFQHCVSTAANIPADLKLRMAAILHDIGKPRSRVEHKYHISFHRHEMYSATYAEQLLMRMGYKKKFIEDVVHLISNHMYHYTGIDDEERGLTRWSDKAVRRFIRNNGIKDTDEKKLKNHPLFLLRKADRKGNGFKSIPVTQRQKDFEERLIKTMAYDAVNKFKLAVNGNDIIEEFNIKQSKEIGSLLQHLRTLVKNKTVINDKNKLLEECKKYLGWKKR